LVCVARQVLSLSYADEWYGKMFSHYLVYQLFGATVVQYKIYRGWTWKSMFDPVGVFFRIILFKTFSSERFESLAPSSGNRVFDYNVFVRTIYYGICVLLR
jgi:hypothetical protein